MLTDSDSQLATADLFTTGAKGSVNEEFQADEEPEDETQPVSQPGGDDSAPPNPRIFHPVAADGEIL